MWLDTGLFSSLPLILCAFYWPVAAVRDTPPAFTRSSFHVRKVSITAWPKLKHHTYSFKAVSAGLWLTCGVILKASIDVLWGAWPSVQYYSITVIFHCGQTWIQSLTAVLGIWQHVSLLFQFLTSVLCALVWIYVWPKSVDFCFKEKNLYGVVMEIFYCFVYCSHI